MPPISSEPIARKPTGEAERSLVQQPYSFYHDCGRCIVAAKRRLGLVALVFFLGVIVGSVVGELIGALLPEGNVLRELFVTGATFTVGPVPVDLIVIGFTLGFTLKVNLISVLGIVVVALILRMYC
jgi:hypothetical protein